MTVQDAIPHWQISQFATNVQHRLQAMGGRLRSLVDFKGAYKGIQAAVVNYVGATEAIKITGRKGVSPDVGLQHERRWVDPVGYEWGTLVDTNDALFTGISPTGIYTEAGVKAMQRAEDMEILNAFWRTAKIGETGSEAEAWSDTGYKVDENEGGASSGLNKAKLLALMELFIGYDIDVENEQINMIITEEERTDLMSDSTLQSRDFMNNQMLVTGKLLPVLGFNFHVFSKRTLEKTNDMKLVGSHSRALPVWVKRGMHLGSWQDQQVEVGKDPNYKFMPRVYMKQFYGATRLEPGHVLKCVVYH